MKTRNAQPDRQKHSRDCSICAHRDRDQIEREFCEWKPIAAIAKERKISRTSLYRHIHATGLLEKRSRNIKSALSRVIERGYNVHVTAAALISAISAFAKINSETGEWIDKTEDVNAGRNLAQFDRMTQGEMLEYARSGKLPEWWNPSAPDGTR
jgi:predicted DNA-binding ribbon-helix-helix protein